LGFGQKSLACGAFSSISFAYGTVGSRKNLAWHFSLHTICLSVRHLISVSALVYRFNGVKNDSNSIIQ